MANREEKNHARELAAWLDGGGPRPSSDAEAQAVARTAAMLVNALAPTPLSSETRARMFERALAEGSSHQGDDDPVTEVLRAVRQLPAPAWVGLGGVAAGVALGVALLRQREMRPGG